MKRQTLLTCSHAGCETHILKQPTTCRTDTSQRVFFYTIGHLTVVYRTDPDGQQLQTVARATRITVDGRGSGAVVNDG